MISHKRKNVDVIQFYASPPPPPSIPHAVCPWAIVISLSLSLSLSHSRSLCHHLTYMFRGVVETQAVIVDLVCSLASLFIRASCSCGEALLPGAAVVQFGGASLHPSCYRCAGPCKMQLSVDDTVYTHHANPWCKRCYAADVVSDNLCFLLPCLISRVIHSQTFIRSTRTAALQPPPATHRCDRHHPLLSSEHSCVCQRLLSISACKFLVKFCLQVTSLFALWHPR